MSGTDFVFNIAKGRVVEFYNRVENDDPATSALIVLVLASSGLEGDSTLVDKDTVSALVSGTTNEVTNTGYARKTLTNTELSALPSPDDTNDRYDVDIPDQTWSSVSAGDVWAKLIIAYDATAGGCRTYFNSTTALTSTVDSTSAFSEVLSFALFTRFAGVASGQVPSFGSSSAALDFFECLVFDRKISDAEAQAWMAEIKTEWGFA